MMRRMVASGVQLMRKLRRMSEAKLVSSEAEPVAAWPRESAVSSCFSTFHLMKSCDDMASGDATLYTSMLPFCGVPLTVMLTSPLRPCILQSPVTKAVP